MPRQRKKLPGHLLYGKATKPGRKKRVKGQCPLQGQGTASLVGVGATPQLFRVKPTQRKKSTRCRQRSVPASNFARPQTRPQAADSTNCTVSRQMGATVLLVGKSKLVFIASRGFRLCGGESGALRSPPTPLRSAHLCGLIFIVAGGIAPAGATRGLSGRPLDPFGRHYRNEF